MTNYALPSFSGIRVLEETMNNYASEAEARDGLAELRTTNESNLLPFELFWGGFMSQWDPTGFKVGSLWFPTAEHWMMWSKARCFEDHATAERILAASHPKEAKELGRKVRYFDENVWMGRRYDIVRTGNLLKFSQNPLSRKSLFATGNKILVEASPHDRVWGVGRGAEDPRAYKPGLWDGSNLLGFALMSVRYSLSLLP
jgi:ribA/ribD-fused uncharacterized protein